MEWIEPPGGRPWGLYAVCAASLAMNVYFAMSLPGRTPHAEPVQENATALVATPVAPAPTAAAPAVDTPANAPAAPGSPPPPGTDVHRLDVVSSLSHTFVDNLPENRGAVVSQVFARLFFWNVDLRRDLLRGDEIRVAYTWDGALAHIPVASYHSKKLDKTFAAYEFQATGDSFPSWWDDAGDEVSLRLTESPLAQYQQITSLLKDRPTHRGMDFKVPVGTPVVSPRAGRVERIDWNLKFNGNCVEVRNADGAIARFLHLSRVDVKPGDTLTAGQSVGLSGNTGRSTNPHLHYEIERNGEVVDPVDYHGVERRKLTGEDLARFEAEKSRMGGWLAWAK